MSGYNEARLAQLREQPGFRLMKLDLIDQQATADLFWRERFGRVVNLAAQAGVRSSPTHSHAYIATNVLGFSHVSEGCRHAGVEHLVFASGSGELCSGGG